MSKRANLLCDKARRLTAIEQPDRARRLLEAAIPQPASTDDIEAEGVADAVRHLAEHQALPGPPHVAFEAIGEIGCSLG